MRWLKHAFAVDPPGAAEPDETQRRVADRLCREVVRRRMTTPVIAFLEMSRPLNYMGAQVLHFLRPFVEPFLDAASWQAFALYLEQRGSVEWICRRIETLEAEADARERRGGTTPNPDSDEARHDEQD